MTVAKRSSRGGKEKEPKGVKHSKKEEMMEMPAAHRREMAAMVKDWNKKAKR